MANFIKISLKFQVCEYKTEILITYLYRTVECVILTTQWG